jgi:hypothetical protein
VQAVRRNACAVVPVLEAAVAAAAAAAAVGNTAPDSIKSGMAVLQPRCDDTRLPFGRCTLLRPPCVCWHAGCQHHMRSLCLVV